MDKEIENLKNDFNISSIFYYGSTVYETNNEKSDIDLIVVGMYENLKLTISGIDIKYYSEKNFLNDIENHDLSCLECLWLDKKHIIKNNLFIEFELNKQKLRNEFSQKSSNSWVKAKKKLTVEKDYSPYIGKKSAWHALRILDFGKQIAINEKIVDYTSCNDLLPKILSCNSWDEINSQYKSLYNKKATEFREAAPKIESNNSFKSKP